MVEDVAARRCCDLGLRESECHDKLATRYAVGKKLGKKERKARRLREQEREGSLLSFYTPQLPQKLIEI